MFPLTILYENGGSKFRKWSFLLEAASFTRSPNAILL